MSAPRKPRLKRPLPAAPRLTLWVPFGLAGILSLIYLGLWAAL